VTRIVRQQETGSYKREGHDFSRAAKIRISGASAPEVCSPRRPAIGHFKSGPHHDPYIKREDVPQEVINKEKEILKAQALNEGKPANIVEKMVDGRIEKFYKEICLLEQPFI
jgi:hypothetical protein